jgi:2-dehydro-3-deoxyphosphogluconate aldolase/(4S)-4-hydroxy-2-oxoglutarate aldolase
MSESLSERLLRASVVPLIQAGDAATALATVRALLAGGLGVIEVVLRTDAALTCLREVVQAFPDAVVGAGTVLTPDQAAEAIDAGAAFIVSPGLHDGVVHIAQDAALPVFPGIATATELQAAWNLGLDTVKFFPAGLAGGIPMLKALAAVFRGVRFMPTGGISAGNLAKYLALPQVMACGGSWLTPADAIAAGDYAAVTRLASEARAIARQVREG